MPLPWLEGLERAKRPVRVPSRADARGGATAARASPRNARWLMASLLYGAGLRLRECLKLRVKDVDFGYRQILGARRQGRQGSRDDAAAIR